MTLFEPAVLPMVYSLEVPTKERKKQVRFEVSQQAPDGFKYPCKLRLNDPVIKQNRTHLGGSYLCHFFTLICVLFSKSGSGSIRGIELTE